jgi:hypothetical protein
MQYKKLRQQLNMYSLYIEHMNHLHTYPLDMERSVHRAQRLAQLDRVRID